MPHPKTDEAINKKLASILKLALKEAGIKQSELAKHLGVSQSAISHWKRGKGTITLHNFIKLARLLGIDYLTVRDILELNAEQVFNLQFLRSGQIIQLSGFYRCTNCKETVFLRKNERVARCRCGNETWERVK